MLTYYLWVKKKRRGGGRKLFCLGGVTYWLWKCRSVCKITLRSLSNKWLSLFALIWIRIDSAMKRFEVRQTPSVGFHYQQHVPSQISIVARCLGGIWKELVGDVLPIIFILKYVCRMARMCFSLRPKLSIWRGKKSNFGLLWSGFVETDSGL